MEKDKNKIEKLYKDNKKIENFLKVSEFDVK